MAFSGAFDTSIEALQRQRGHLMCFAPVFLAIGIGCFFALGQEPGVAVYACVAAGTVISVALARALRFTLGPAFAALAVFLIGFGLAGWRAHQIAAPVIEFRYYGAIEGRVVAIDRSASDKVRLTLDRVRLERIAPERMPGRVRVSLHGQGDLPEPLPGAHAMMTGHLSPPPSPAEPHGFDFQRHAWFQGIGAVGYTRNPAVSFAPPERGPALWIFRLRMTLSSAIQARIPGDAGGVAAAVTTGDRSAMSQEVLSDLRRTNLAHLLAISGLHMGLLTGFVFALVRLVLVLIPYTALAWPTKKIAAVVALIAGAGYLALSGGAVATERAFIMAAVIFGAVLFNRRAITLRGVAIAALIVLALRPEALLGPGFQMSFAATTALVVTFRWLNAHDMFGMPRRLRPVAAVVISSAVAGLATAPIGAAHFNIVSHYGLIANLLSVPVMGLVVMPAAVLAAILSLVGLAGPALWLMGLGLRWILFVGHTIAGLEGAVGRVPAPGPEVLPLLALGALALILWAGRARWLGLVPAAAAVSIWAASERPELLISPTGGLIGVMAAEGRALSKPRGDGFVAASWLENDADAASQEAAFERGPGRKLALGGQEFLHLTGKSAREARCVGKAILVLGDKPEAALGCDAHTPETLRLTGAVAYRVEDGALKAITAREVTGRRIWNDREVRAHFLAP
ncbi:MAG: ComEC/Rec2 family competence protein [Pseudomonadota bacterium]